MRKIIENALVLIIDFVVIRVEASVYDLLNRSVVVPPSVIRNIDDKLLVFGWVEISVDTVAGSEWRAFFVDFNWENLADWVFPLLGVWLNYTYLHSSSLRI